MFNFFLLTLNSPPNRRWSASSSHSCCVNVLVCVTQRRNAIWTQINVSLFCQTFFIVPRFKEIAFSTMSFRGSSAILVNNSGDPPNGRTMAAAIAAAKVSWGRTSWKALFPFQWFSIISHHEHLFKLLIFQPSGLLPDDLGTKQAKVIMDYDAVLPQEISVTQNDVSLERRTPIETKYCVKLRLLLLQILIVYRLPGMDAEYVMAEKGGKRGKLPVSYIELL